jgi:hypothetical protein
VQKPVASAEEPASTKDAAQPLATYEQSIIQMLDRWVPDEQTGMYFKAEAFPDTVDLWDGIPLVFANDHPDLDAFVKDQAAALADVKGRIVGVCRRPRFVQEGHPHLRTALEVTDKDCVALWEAGKLSLSTAFWASVSDTDVLGDVKPNHVLLFEEDDVNQPKDKGTLIQKGIAMTAKPTTPIQNAGLVNAGDVNGILSQISALFARLAGGNNPSPDVAGEIQEAGDVIPTTTVNPNPDPVPGAFGQTPTPPAGTSRAITPAGAGIPQPIPVLKQDPPFEVEQPNEDVYKASNQKVDTMTTETEALNQKIVSMSAELANKAAIVGEKDANIVTLKAALAQKEADFKIAGDILAEKEAAIANKDKEIVAVKAEKDAAIANKDKEIETVKAELATFVQKENDAKFDAYLKQIPAGFSNKEEDVKALRALWDNDPRALVNKSIEMIQSVKTPNTKTDGKSVIPTDGAMKQKKSLGHYNMETHSWEDTPQ